MIKIRLARHGKTHFPIYRIVVVDARNRKDSSFLSFVGTYSPLEEKCLFDIDKYKKYLSIGAQPTQTVLNLYKNFCKKSS